MYFSRAVTRLTHEREEIPIGTLCTPGVYLYLDEPVQITMVEGKPQLHQLKPYAKPKVFEYDGKFCTDVAVTHVHYDGKVFGEFSYFDRSLPWKPHLVGDIRIYIIDHDKKKHALEKQLAKIRKAMTTIEKLLTCYE